MDRPLKRVDAPELMDADDLPPATYAAVLGDLARVNTLTLARRPTLAFVARIMSERPVRILDVGFGDGDMLRALARRFGDRVELVGIDLNVRSEHVARVATASSLKIDYRTGDYAELAGERWDAVISSLVAHHMTHDQLVAFVRFMDGNAMRGWFVNDLYRAQIAQYAFRGLASLLRLHPIVRHDGALSVARSLRPRDWAPVLAEAGVGGARVRRVFPYRLCVECRR